MLTADAFRGSRGLPVAARLLFFSSTSDASAALVARSTCSGLWMTDLSMEVYGTSATGSNSPVRIRTVNTRTSAVSRTSSLSRPARTASITLAVVISSPLQLRSLPERRA